MFASKIPLISSELQSLLPALMAYLEILKARETKYERLTRKANLEASIEADKPARYPVRAITRKNYEEEEVSDDDDYLFYDDCGTQRKGSCPSHDHLSLIPNCQIPKDGSIPYRAFESKLDFLSICKSGMKGAGLGVWTEFELPKGVVFGPYEGTIVHQEKDAHRSGFCWKIKKNGCISHYIDASNASKSNWMRFVNCATVESCQNLIAFQFKGEIYYRTYKPALASCKLLVWYGESYASELDIDLSENEIPDDTVGGYMCQRCNSAFISNFLKAHARSRRDGSSTHKHKCSFCSYSSHNAHHIEKHLLTHSGEKPHKCQTCGKQFSQKQDLERHLVVHSGACPFLCEVWQGLHS